MSATVVDQAADEGRQEEINLELRPEHERSLQRRLKVTLALMGGCLFAALLLLQLRHSEDGSTGIFHQLSTWFNSTHEISGNDVNGELDLDDDAVDWDREDGFIDDEFGDDELDHTQVVLPTKHSSAKHPPPTHWPTPSPTTFSPTPKPMPVPYVNICTPPIPSSIDDGGGFTVLDHIDLMHDSDDCINGMYDCDGAISALVIGGRGEIVIAGFPSYSRPRTSVSVGEKAGMWVGVVRTFAYSCDHNAYKQLGPDLYPENPEAAGDMFGSVVVGTESGRVLAIGAKVDNKLDWARTGVDTNLKPYVEVYHLVDDGNSQRWGQLGRKIMSWQAPAKESGEKAVAGIALNEDGSVVALFDKDDGTKSCGNEGTNCRINVFQYDESRGEEDDGNKTKSLRKTKNANNSWLMLGNPIPFPTWPEQWKSGPGGSVPLLELVGKKSGTSQLILTLKNPFFGTVQYGFDLELGQWEQVEEIEVQVPSYFDSAMYFSIDSIDSGAGPSGGAIVSMTGEVGEPDGPGGKPRGGAQHAAVITDLSAIKAEDRIVYSKSFLDWQVKIDTAVSRYGSITAVLPSTASIRNNDLEMWTQWPVSRRLGEVQIFVRKNACRSSESAGIGGGRVLEEPAPQQFAEKWSKGVDANNTCWFAFEESLKISGRHWVTQDKLYVWLSDNGKIAVVGNTFSISLYHIHVPSAISEDKKDNVDNANLDELGVSSEPSEFSSDDELNPNELVAADICPPFLNATGAMHAGDLILDLPGINRHTLSIASSNDASIVAVGISLLDSEERGMVRVYAWSCSHLKFVQFGQDLFGGSKYDGFGISVDISSDGMFLCVGANQPLPSENGYVEVYKYNIEDWKWKLVGQRIKVASQNGYRIGVGRNVEISDDGSVVAFSGINSPYAEVSCFVGVMTLKEDEWVKIGNSLIESGGIHKIHISLSGDGKTLGVVAGSTSYEMFDSFARVYDINLAKNSWSEHVISKPSEEYKQFLGYGVAVNREGTKIVLAGTNNTLDSHGILIRFAERTAMSEWVLKSSVIAPRDRKEAHSIGAVSGFDAKGTTFAVGVNGYSDSDPSSDLGWAKGSLYLSSIGNNTENDMNWDSFRMVKGEAKLDQLGSTLCISQDGTFAIAGSRAGYLRFFRMT